MSFSAWNFIGGGSLFLSMGILLIMLVSLEMMALGLFWLLSNWVGYYGGEDYFMLVFLSMGVCEGAMGLAILVCLVHSHGSGNFDSIRCYHVKICF